MWKWKSESDVTCGQVWWPILGICALYLTHLKCTHTAVNTHTPRTHTRSSGQPMLRRPGSSWGFGALLKGTSVVVLKVERVLYIHSPTYNSCRTWDSNPWPLGYESDSLTIRPQLPQNKYMWINLFWRPNDLRSIKTEIIEPIISFTGTWYLYIMTGFRFVYQWFVAKSPAASASMVLEKL